ncbi:hypothetical protein ACFSC6_00165 [Rufibacter sediminis]|uniref:Uncharacterized protein n=1 Tax=Rufibacter sediminis TaxID=2762756 RepID=A0ABR6VM00_9BACT|nr:hypothetical protein [Rufibacter sediminis]MBC3538235.1 hypothetical protein [Rufibacter sediminis]
MGNFYETSEQETPESLKDSTSDKVLALLRSEMYERGEAIDEVLVIATSYLRILQQQDFQDTEKFDCVYWHLDTLIQEALNMLENPKKDLFLYLKALHDFKETAKETLPFLNTSAA